MAPIQYEKASVEVFSDGYAEELRLKLYLWIKPSAPNADHFLSTRKAYRVPLVYERKIRVEQNDIVIAHVVEDSSCQHRRSAQPRIPEFIIAQDDDMQTRLHLGCQSCVLRSLPPFPAHSNCDSSHSILKLSKSMRLPKTGSLVFK